MDGVLYQDIMHEIREIAKDNTLVIVEGKNDVASCNELGIKNVIEIKQPLFSLIESIEDKEVVLLVDLDKEGKSLYSKLKKDLVRRGVRVNDKLREMLFRTPVRQVEGLYNYLERWKSQKE
ncbi:MAG: toprim domain-containing protein [Candidatus Woesearchaeota archaeon]